MSKYVKHNNILQDALGISPHTLKAKLKTVMQFKSLGFLPIANEIGITRQTLMSFISGDTLPSYQTLAKIKNWLEAQEVQ